MLFFNDTADGLETTRALGGIAFGIPQGEGADWEHRSLPLIAGGALLGVKDAFWRAGTSADFEDMLRKMEMVETMASSTPACLAKIVTGAVEYAQYFGFPPHPDYRHASKLLDGIDPSSCSTKFSFGRAGKPFYIQGPNESFAQAAAIIQRVQKAGGHFIGSPSVDGREASAEMGLEFERFGALEHDESDDEAD